MLADIGRNIDEFFGKISNNLINLKPFNWLAEIKNFNKSEKILFALVICNVFFTFIMQLKFNLYNFYSTYGAGEILINYKGGLVRRGLLGEFYSIFAGTWLFEPVLFISIYGIALIVAYYFIRWMIYVFDPTTLILVFGSPALFAGLFYNWDVLRRDFIIMGGVILIHWLIVNSKKFSYSLIKLLLLMLLIYIPCFLIHESMLFFMGGPFLFLLLLYKGIAKKIWIFIFFIGIAVISSYIGLYSGSMQKCQLMVSWWKAIYPQLSFLLAMESTNALPFSKHPSLLGHFIHSNSGPSIILAYILGFILIFWVTYSTKVYTALKNISHNFKFYSFGFFLVWIGCILIYARAMHDLGRQIPMENFYAIIMIVTIHKLNIIDGNLLPKYKKINLSNSFVLLLIGAYLFAWQIKVFINYNVPTYLDTQLWQRMILFINSSFS